ncbi:MAG TPA: Phenylacetic acid catabolic protein [Candidatus Elarobacter sp.]|nr:Phenylacetic acid catabolic protein [Candidatus Elarobacter sp.]HEV2738244.1 Phenylacetic acid catabolic protein [Candidatus Elarobacter sp.]
MDTATVIVKTVAELASAPAEYREAAEKIVRSHAINELYGAQVFDEPAVAFAPTPYWKWLTCRVAMEEYGHHQRFFRLGVKMGIPQDAMIPHKTDKRPLSIFEFPLRSWTEFCVIKLLADMAEIIQVEDLMECTFHPLRDEAAKTMPEEKFHAGFGVRACTELCATDQGRVEVQAAIDALFPGMPAFFGASHSKNNAIFRKWGLKQRTNEAMRADYVERARGIVGKLGLRLPATA